MEEETKNESFEDLQQNDHQEKTVPTLERHNIPKGVPMKKVVFRWSAKACFAIGLLTLIVGIAAILCAMMSNQIASTLFAIAGFFPAPVAIIFFIISLVKGDKKLTPFAIMGGGFAVLAIILCIISLWMNMRSGGHPILASDPIIESII